MKITIESTNYGDKVTKEVKNDDLDITEMMELVKDALKGYGYTEKTVEDYFGSDSYTDAFDKKFTGCTPKDLDMLNLKCEPQEKFNPNLIKDCLK